MDNVISQLDNVLVTKEDMALTVQVIHIFSIVFLSIMYDLPFSMSICTSFYSEQNLIVLGMGLAQIKGHVMTQLEPVNVILDMKEILVKVH